MLFSLHNDFFMCVINITAQNLKQMAFIQGDLKTPTPFYGNKLPPLWGFGFVLVFNYKPQTLQFKWSKLTK